LKASKELAKFGQEALPVHDESAYYRREIESLRAQLHAEWNKSGHLREVKQESEPDSKRQRAEALLDRPVRDLDWWHLQTLREGLGEEAVQAATSEIADRAARDLDSGASAASLVVIGHEATPYDRARFLEMRARVVEEWKPRPGIESMLVDHLVQAHWAYEQWMAKHVGLTVLPQLPEPDLYAGSQARGAQSPRFLESAEAEAHALTMATRWQNQMLKIVRHLRDFRKVSPVIVQNAGQVNVSEQQVNVNSMRDDKA